MKKRRKPVSGKREVTMASEAVPFASPFHQSSAADRLRKVSGLLWMRSTSPLGLLQMFSLASFIAVAATAMVLYWFMTDEYFRPFSQFITSARLVMPPAVVLIVSYVVFFLTGTPAHDVPKALLSALRNKFFQSHYAMWLWIGFSVAAIGGALAFIKSTAPPAHQDMAKLILSTSADGGQLLKKRLDVVRTANPGLATDYLNTSNVFVERDEVNAGKREPSVARAKALVHALERASTDYWAENPLRTVGLAEAYSLYAQAAQQLEVGDLRASDKNAKVLFARSLALYESVAASSSPMITVEVRLSAVKNSGNTHYYAGDLSNALRAWREANDGVKGRPSLGTWGNIIASLVLIGRYDEAIVEGNNARRWAESSGKAFTDPYGFAGVLGNLGLAQIGQGSLAEAGETLLAAHAFQDDDLTAQNLIVVEILRGRRANADGALRRLSPPAAPDTAAEFARKPKAARCVYLLWGLSAQSDLVRASNFLAFLGDAYSKAEVEALSKADVSALRQRVQLALPRAAAPCSTLGSIKAFADVLSLRDGEK